MIYYITMSRVPLKTILFFLIVFVLGAGVGYKLVGNTPNIPQVAEEKNIHKAFISEVYDKIRENYWDNISDAQLLDLFKLSLAKNGGDITVAKFEDKNKFLETFRKVLGNMTDEQKNKFSVSVVSSVLASLSPNSRSGLYTQKQEEQLKNTVSNINPQKDLYKDLGLAKDASETAILQAFEQQSKELAKDKSPEAREKLKTVTYAKDTLTAKEKKEKYDQKGIEPTISSKIIAPGILYVQFRKFSPTSLEEFQKAFEDYKDTANLGSLIFDLRGNVGGAIDATPYFLGYFLGPGQYAFDFYHKGEYLPFKTQNNKLAGISRYKQVVVLVDENTQSSAEMLAASLKKYHQGVIVGNRTKGWGTVERIFPLENQISKEEKYSLFLVHSITLRDDNQPIEGRGVDPDVSIKDPNWPQKLLEYFNNQRLVNAVQEVL